MLRLTTRGLTSCALILLAVAAPAQTNSFAARAERAFHEAQAAVRKSPEDNGAANRLARLAFDWAEYSKSDEQRAEIAQAGIAATRAVIARQSTNAAAHHWLGMNLGQLARTKTLGALKIVREMEEEFHRARALDPRTDYAGPDRSLARLYRAAPGWPASIGDRKKSREHFDHAIRLHPEFPDNQLGLLEAFDAWSDKKNFVRQLAVVEKILAEAQTRFTDPEWDASWADWRQRLAKMKARASLSGSLSGSDASLSGR